MLPALAFDGATKRNKPSLAVGALVFARVVAADRDLEAELTCQVSTTASGAEGGHFAKKDWVTGQSVYGELKGGTVVKASMLHARRYVCVPTTCARVLVRSCTRVLVRSCARVHVCSCTRVLVRSLSVSWRVYGKATSMAMGEGDQWGGQPRAWASASIRAFSYEWLFIAPPLLLHAV